MPAAKSRRKSTNATLCLGLGDNEETAADDACKMEHDISDTVFEAIKNHVAGR